MLSPGSKDPRPVRPLSLQRGVSMRACQAGSLRQLIVDASVHSCRLTHLLALPLQPWPSAIESLLALTFLFRPTSNSDWSSLTSLAAAIVRPPQYSQSSRAETSCQSLSRMSLSKDSRLSMTTTTGPCLTLHHTIVQSLQPELPQSHHLHCPTVLPSTPSCLPAARASPLFHWSERYAPRSRRH